MRKPDAVSEYKLMRDKELTEIFRRMVMDPARSGSRPLRELYGFAARQPASRFWVSEERATVVIRDRLAGRADFSGMKPESRRMFTEILNRVRPVLARAPGMPVARAVREVVNGPAPEFYLTPLSAKVIIYARIRVERAEKRRQAEARAKVLDAIRAKSK